MKINWARVAEAQELARTLPLAAFRRQCGSGILLSHTIRSGQLQTGWVTALGHKVARGTHSLLRQLPANFSGTTPALSEDDWDNLQVEGQIWLSLPWSRGASNPPWLLVGRRASADIVINDFTVSVKHAKIQRSGKGKKLTLIDLGSTNGTEADGTTLEGDTPVEVGSRSIIAFGRQQFLFLNARDFYALAGGDESVSAFDETRP